MQGLIPGPEARGGGFNWWSISSQCHCDHLLQQFHPQLENKHFLHSFGWIAADYVRKSVLQRRTCIVTLIVGWWQWNIFDHSLLTAAVDTAASNQQLISSINTTSNHNYTGKHAIQQSHNKLLLTRKNYLIIHKKKLFLPRCDGSDCNSETKIAQMHIFLDQRLLLRAN